MRASIQRSLARLHTTYLDTVYLHDAEYIAESKAPRTSGDHRAALGTEADAYGLGEGQEAVIYGDGDREVLAAIGELRKQQDAGVVRRVGISGASSPNFCTSRCNVVDVQIIIITTTTTTIHSRLSFAHPVTRCDPGQAHGAVQAAGRRHVVLPSQPPEPHTVGLQDGV